MAPHPCPATGELTYRQDHEETIMNDLADLAARTPDVYVRNGLRYDDERTKTLFERSWLDRFLALLPSRPTVLDAGCGAGLPIAGYLIAQGCRLTGLDLSAPMLDRARGRFPEAAWLNADMRHLDLPDRFDGILGWHSFFHLTPAAQRETLVRFAAHLCDKGALMLTVGPGASETIGHVGGAPVYHASLALDDYAAILDELGLRIVRFVAEDPDCDGASVLLARKDREARR